MNTPTTTLKEWFTRTLRYNGWVWTAILLSILVCGLVAWLHFMHQRAVDLAMERTESLRLARLDLSKGFLYFSLADTPGSPFDREQGLVLIEQAITEFEKNLDALEAAPGAAALPDVVDREAADAAFRQQVEIFRNALQLWRTTGADQRGAATDLRLAFSDLERQADEIDRLTRQSLVDLSNQLKRQFTWALIAAAASLLGVCAIVLFAGRARLIIDEALRESEARFRALFSNNHAPMLVIVPETGLIIDANPAACAYYGWSLDEIIGRQISDINTLTEEEIQIEITKAVSEFRHFFEFRHRLASGEVRDVEVFSGPIESGGKKVLFSIIQDVTERKKAEIALEASEERYRQLLQMAPVGITVHDGEVFLFVNPAAAHIFRANSPEQIIGRPLSEFMSPEQQAESNQRYQHMLAGDANAYPAESTLRRLDGTTGFVQVTAARVIYQGRQSVQAILSDISERKQSQARILAAQSELQRLLKEADESRQALLSVVEDQKLAEEQLNLLNATLERRVQERTAQLEATNKELEAFAYSVSHDLRSPLRGIDGWSYALLEDYGEQLNEEARSYLARVRSEAKRMGQLIDDLLRLSRVTRAEMQLEDVNLSEMAQSITARLQEENPDRQITFSVAPELHARADEHLIEIVLTNLLSNACKFTGRQPQAQVIFGKNCSTDGKSAFYVRDNGVGFDMAYTGKLFGAFQRLHHQSEFPGTGIGLATVQRIIHRHGGKVWAEAEKGSGATFWFTLGE